MPFSFSLIIIYGLLWGICLSVIIWESHSIVTCLFHVTLFGWCSCQGFASTFIPQCLYMSRCIWAATWLCLLRYWSVAFVWHPDMICSTVSGWMTYPTSLCVIFFHDVFIVVPGVKSLILCCCYVSFCFTFESTVLHPLEGLLYVYIFFFQVVWEFPMHWLFRPPVFHHLLIVLLIHILEFLCLLCSSQELGVFYIFWCSCFSRVFCGFLGYWVWGFTCVISYWSHRW